MAEVPRNLVESYYAQALAYWKSRHLWGIISAKRKWTEKAIKKAIREILANILSYGGNPEKYDWDAALEKAPDYDSPSDWVKALKTLEEAGEAYLFRSRSEMAAELKAAAEQELRERLAEAKKMFKPEEVKRIIAEVQPKFVNGHEYMQKYFAVKSKLDETRRKLRTTEEIMKSLRRRIKEFEKYPEVVEKLRKELRKKEWELLRLKGEVDKLQKEVTDAYRMIDILKRRLEKPTEEPKVEVLFIRDIDEPVVVTVDGEKRTVRVTRRKGEVAMIPKNLYDAIKDLEKRGLMPPTVLLRRDVKLSKGEFDRLWSYFLETLRRARLYRQALAHRREFEETIDWTRTFSENKALVDRLIGEVAREAMWFAPRKTVKERIERAKPKWIEAVARIAPPERYPEAFLTYLEERNVSYEEFLTYPPMAKEFILRAFREWLRRRKK